MADIPTYDPKTQDLAEIITTTDTGEEVRTYKVVDMPEWRLAEVKRATFNEELPATVDDINAGIVEVAGMADENATTIEDINAALVELAALIDKQT